jgi:DNA-binding NtrC family response regulator
VIHLVIPPLRDRLDDLEPLLRHFLATFGAKYGIEPPELRPEVLPAMLQHPWPGNVRELKNVAERLIVRARKGPIGLEDLPTSITGPAAIVAAKAAHPVSGIVEASPRSAAALFDRVVARRESFWTAVYAPFMARDLTRDDVRALIRTGLQHTRGNYKVLLELFNMEPGDYKRFLNFLRKHQCHMPFQQFRTSEPLRPVAEPNRSVSSF